MFTPPMTYEEWALDQERIRINRAICRRVCSPSDVNGSSPSSATPGEPGPGVCIPNDATAAKSAKKPMRQRVRRVTISPVISDLFADQSNVLDASACIAQNGSLFAVSVAPLRLPVGGNDVSFYVP